jgi:ATP phosphoribosyltransferase
MSERLKIVLPGGELEERVFDKIRKSGLGFTVIDRRYLISGSLLPVDLVIVRASSVPKFVTAKKSEIGAGITGSDVLWEYGMGKDAGEALAIESQSALFLGATARLESQIRDQYKREVTIEDFRGTTVVTKFPRITREVFRERNIKTRGILRSRKVTIVEEPGKTEAIQYVNPQCNGLMDVIGKGTTSEANGISVIERIHDVTVRMIQSPGLTRQKKQILCDFTAALQ